MTDQPLAQTIAAPDIKAGAAALGVLLLTSIHHIYGAVIYDTPWRLHIVMISVPVAIIIAALLYASRVASRPTWRLVAKWTAAAVILVFPIVMIGFYEGGFNHVYKNIVFFAFGEAAMRADFPSAMVEMPNDLFFEVSGILQFPLAVYTLTQLRGFLWPTRQA